MISDQGPKLQQDTHSTKSLFYCLVIISSSFNKNM